eukprot:Sspe_Gene.74213::Locus_45738_Transcript_1_1_Confidence_1.000_Length_647::g.74213::m.74213
MAGSGISALSPELEGHVVRRVSRVPADCPQHKWCAEGVSQRVSRLSFVLFDGRVVQLEKPGEGLGYELYYTLDGDRAPTGSTPLPPGCSRAASGDVDVLFSNGDLTCCSVYLLALRFTSVSETCGSIILSACPLFRESTILRMLQGCLRKLPIEVVHTIREWLGSRVVHMEMHLTAVTGSRITQTYPAPPQSSPGV